MRDDSGFSAMELLIASLIGLLVLTVAYMVFNAGMKGFRTVENDTIASRAAAASMERMSRAIREGSQFSIANDYELQFTADWDDDGIAERIRYYVPLNSRELRVDTADSGGGATQTVVISPCVRNRVLGTRVFTYYSTPGTEISNPASRTLDVHIVHVTILTSANTTPAPAPYRVETDLYLRNK